MYRAIIFDFYSVWGPDRLESYLQQLREIDEASAKTVEGQIQQYYNGLSGMQELADSIRFKFRLSGQEVDTSDLILREDYVSPQVIQFIQYLHGHFLKVGILANLGKQEREILEAEQQKFDLFDTITSASEPGTTLLSQETFSRALYDLGEPPEGCLAISGHDDYLQFAASLGLGTMKFEGFPKLQADIEQIIQSPA